MRWLAAPVAIVMLTPGGVLAADLPAAPPYYPAPAAIRAVANWGGFYLGANVGAGLARDQSTFSAGGVNFATVDTAVFGAVAGGQAGYN